VRSSFSPPAHPRQSHPLRAATPVESFDASAESPRSAPEDVAEDSPTTTVAGYTFIAPVGWTLRVSAPGIRVLFRCWVDRTPYNESRYLDAHQKRQSPLLKFAAQPPS
jgi:hypothetical protein